MRWLALALVLAGAAAQAKEVARIDDVPVLARQIGLAEPATLPAAANALRQRAMKSALQWFVAQEKVAATDADLGAYGKWHEEFQRRQGRADAGRPVTEAQAASRKRVWTLWITGFKANKALYEKYGGRVGLTKFGPEPIGALETLLRGREKAGALRIFDEALAREFWAWYAVQPRRLAKPEEIDFTFYWLKPPHDPDRPRR